jgi:hypothetical protein
MLREEDKRNFRRYRNESECELILPSGVYKGKIIDCSDGVGVSINHASNLEKDTSVHVRVYDLNMEFKGRIAWAQQAGDHIRAGVRRVDNFRGNVRFYRLADLLIGINRSAKTGVLTFESGSIRRKVFIETGDIIWATSTHGDERIGEHLLKSGVITLTELEEASHREFKTGQKLEDIILEQCTLTPEEISREGQKQVEDILLNLFLLEEGMFEFIERPIHSDEKMSVPLSTANIIYRGIKKINKYAFIKEMCPSVDDVLNPTNNPLRIFQSLDLEDADKEILSCINGKDPVKKLLAQSSSSDYEALKTISVLMAIGLIDVKKEGDAPVKLPVSELFTKPDVLPLDYPEQIDRLLLTCKNGDYYDVLGVAKDASPDDVEKAYFRLSKEFHPDMHFSLNTPEVKGKLLIITSRITAAYEVLSDPEKKGHYDTQITATALNKEEVPESEKVSDPAHAVTSSNLKYMHDSVAEDKSSGMMNKTAVSMNALLWEDPDEDPGFAEGQDDPGLSIAMAAKSKKTAFISNKWFMYSLIIIALTAVVAVLSIVHKKSGEQLSPAAHIEHIDPVVKEERVKFSALEQHDNTYVQSELSQPDTSFSKTSTLANFREEAFKKVLLDLSD